MQPNKDVLDYLTLKQDDSIGLRLPTKTKELLKQKAEDNQLKLTDYLVIAALTTNHLEAIEK